MNVRRLPYVIVPALIAAALAGATASAQERTVHVSLTEWVVVTDSSSVQEGDIEFEAENIGAVIHNLVVVRTDLAPDALPVAANSQIDRSHLQVIGETETFPGGQSRSVVLALSPGNYVLVCNVPTHYELGMYAGFTVTSVPTAEPTSTEQPRPTATRATPTAPSARLPDTGTGPPSRDHTQLLMAALLAAFAAIATACGAGAWARMRYGAQR